MCSDPEFGKICALTPNFYPEFLVAVVVMVIGLKFINKLISK